MRGTPQLPSSYIRHSSTSLPPRSGGAVGAGVGNAAYRWARLVIALGAFALGAVLAVPAEADQVGNLGQTSASATESLRSFDLAQAFTTGSHSGGYTLQRITVDFATGATVNYDQVYIHVHETDSSGRPTANTVGGTLGVPAATFMKTVPVLDQDGNPVLPPQTKEVPEYYEFSAATGAHTITGGIRLAPNTTYALVFWAGLSSSTAVTRFTSASGEDSGSSSGWSIADNSLKRPRCTGSCSAWTSSTDVLKIQLVARRGRSEDPRWLKVADTEATEGQDETLDFVVTMQPAYSRSITVKYETRGHGFNPATAGQDYEATRGTLTFEAGETTKTVGVPVIDDEVEDDGETMALWLSEPSSPGSIFDSFAIGTIRNTDSIPGPSNAPPTGAPVITGTPRVGGTLTADISGIADEDGMEQPEFAYTWFRNIDGGTYTLSCCGASTYTPRATDVGHAVYVKVSYTDDTGARESVTSEPTAAVLEDGPANTSELSVADAEATEEEDDTLDFVVKLDPAATATVTVDYATADGTATAGDDYTGTSGTLTFAAGDTTKTVSVPITDDTVDDGGETLTLTLSNASGADLGDAVGTGTIRNTEPDPLTASFNNVPSEHDGESAFTFQVAFSEEVGISYKTLRDESFTVANGDVTRARRVDGHHDLWEITVEPASRDAVTIALEGERACGTTGAVCTRGDNPRPLANSPSATVAGPLAASFTDVPAEHTGGEFTIGLTFSEEPELSYKTLRDEAFNVTGGAVRKARRKRQGSNLGWEIQVEPASDADVVVILPVTTDCSAAGAICTGDGRSLSNRLEATIKGPDSQTSSEGFSLAPENGSPSGIWSDGKTAWVADSEDARLYAYQLSDGTRQPARDIATDPVPMGLWSDGETLWVALLSGGLQAHQLSDGVRLTVRDLALDASAAPAGVWSDGETVWVSAWLGNTVHAYRLSDGERVAERDIQLANGNLLPVDVWSDGETLWVADWRERMYAYRLSNGEREPYRDIVAGTADTDPTGLWSGGGTLLSTSWEGGEVRAYQLSTALPDVPSANLAGGQKVQAAGVPEIADPALRSAIEAALGKVPGESVSTEEFIGLEVLKARNAGIQDLSGLQGAAGLKELDLGFNPLADLWPLASLQSLVSLNLDGAAGDLRPLASLTGLKHLSLRNNGIDDLQALTGLVSLAELDVGDNHIEDLYPLAGLSGLQVLRADRNRISDLWPSASLTNLVALDLGSNRVRDLQPLAGMAQLRTLHLGGNGLTELHSLSGLESLRELGLAGNAVEDLGALSNLAGLQRLDLRGNSVGDLSPLRTLPSLVWVHVGGSRIEDLAPLDAQEGLMVEGRDDRNPPGFADDRHRGAGHY